MTSSVDNYNKRLSNLKHLGYESYTQYLRSSKWKNIRKKILVRDSNKCRSCGERASCVHHISYSVDVLNGEDLLPLYSMCNDCHNHIHRTEKKFKKMCQLTLEMVGIIPVQKELPKSNCNLNHATCQKCGKLAKKNRKFCRPCSGQKKIKTVKNIRVCVICKIEIPSKFTRCCSCRHKSNSLATKKSKIAPEPFNGMSLLLNGFN